MPDVAVGFVHDVGPLAGIYGDLRIVAGARAGDEGGIGRMGALVGGAIKDLPHPVINDVQPVGLTKGHGDRTANIHPAHLKMVAAA